MFFPQPFDVDATVKGCQDTYGVTPRFYHAEVEWGGRRIEAASNIVFSNGLLDPWHYGGLIIKT
jgi:lysosomal Pro-X carboxypeptidase